MSRLTVKQRVRYNTGVSWETRTAGQTAIKIDVSDRELYNFTRTMLLNDVTSLKQTVVGSNFYFGEVGKRVVGRKKPNPTQTQLNTKQTKPKVMMPTSLSSRLQFAAPKPGKCLPPPQKKGRIDKNTTTH